MDANEVGPNITRAFLALRDYFEEVAGILAMCRVQFAAADSGLAAVANRGSSNDAHYFRPRTYEHDRAHDWLPRSIGEFYADPRVLEGHSPAPVRRLACVWFTAWDDAADKEPHVTLGVIDDVTGGAAGVAPHQVCSALFRGPLRWHRGWDGADLWHGPRPIRVRLSATDYSMRYRLRWFPFRRMLEGEPEAVVRGQIVEPIVEALRS